LKRDCLRRGSCGGGGRRFNPSVNASSGRGGDKRSPGLSVTFYRGKSTKGKPLYWMPATTKATRKKGFRRENGVLGGMVAIVGM